MDAVGISLAVLIGMLLLAILSMSLFSIRSIISGKHDMQKVVIMFVPFLIFGGTYVSMGDATEAGLVTMLVLMAAMALFIGYSGVRRSFK